MKEKINTLLLFGLLLGSCKEDKHLSHQIHVYRFKPYKDTSELVYCDLHGQKLYPEDTLYKEYRPELWLSLIIEGDFLLDSITINHIVFNSLNTIPKIKEIIKSNKICKFFFIRKLKV